MTTRIATARRAAILAACVLFAAAAAHAQAPVKTQDGVLADQAGMTLYTFDNDSAGKSVCNDQCAKAWPPLSAAADAKPQGDYSIITRDDGARQWAYKGKPLYTFVQDKAAGEVKGDGKMNAWHIAKP